MKNKWNKVMFAGAVVGALGIGAMIGPVVSSAATDLTPVPAQVQSNTNNTWQGMGAGARMGQYFAGAMHDEVAEYLGLSEDDLYQARLDGKSLADLAEEQGKSTEDIVKMLNANKEAQFDQLVKDKVITEAQKDFMLENMQERTEAAIENDAVGPMMGGQGMGGRWNTDENFVPGQGRGAGGGFGGGPRWNR